MILSMLEKFHWWQLLILAGVFALYPVFRAAAVVLVAKCVNTEIAKLAIPLILRPVRPGIFQSRKMSKQVGDRSSENNQPPDG
jgi:hypothetical protein